ncbi:hypothetical protein AB0E27_19305 [Streptomyces sparsogenes]|uniref:hypothetical protein n=1 Tax=Streptomyces sparsogenes TaxID=67365 RepID=UPI003408E8B6
MGDTTADRDEEFIDLYDGAGKRARLGPAVRAQGLRKQRSAAPAKERLKDRAGASGRAMPDVTALTEPGGGRR